MLSSHPSSFSVAGQSNDDIQKGPTATDQHLNFTSANKKSRYSPIQSDKDSKPIHLKTEGKVI